MRECGLKQSQEAEKARQWVTPHAGVWIETESNRPKDNINVSLPMRECGLKQQSTCPNPKPKWVTPHAGVWIETPPLWSPLWSPLVTPHAGVWIETSLSPYLSIPLTESLPMRECGLKPLRKSVTTLTMVTPHAGVWIETSLHPAPKLLCIVTPHAGVWIETNNIMKYIIKDGSLPMRECGLKLVTSVICDLFVSHSPCGSVD